MFAKALLFAALALALGAGTTAMVKATAYSGYARSTGIVVAFRGVTPPPVQKGPQPEPKVAAVVEFTDGTGKAHRFVAGWSWRAPAHALGDRVPVLYPASDPASGVIDSFPEKWGLPLVLGGAATLCLVLGMAIGGLRAR
ncbi:MAG: DUF3592 domain-containing protein [Hyphomicrobiaceae bacterium]|nr:DUF3592 domain-containing protein [Hyphomicrobiaceae bacterium]